MRRFMLVIVVLVSGCGFFNQKPVCPESKPRCTMDEDPAIMGSSSASARDAGR